MVVGKGDDDVAELVVTDELTFLVVRTFFLYKKLGSFCARGFSQGLPGR